MAQLSDYIIVEFPDLSSEDITKLVISKGAVGTQNVKKFEVQNKNGEWVEADYFLGSTINLQGFPTSRNVFDMNGLTFYCLQKKMRTPPR